MLFVWLFFESKWLFSQIFALILQWLFHFFNCLLKSTVKKFISSDIINFADIMLG